MTDQHLILSLTTTVGSADDAQRLAEQLIGNRLAACVQVDAGIVSHYVWQGRSTAEPEWRLTVKTLPRAREAIEAFMAAHHPYELPQLLWQVLEGSSAYVAWAEGLVVSG